MVIVRGLRSTVFPLRARSTSFCPLIFSAEYIGGISGGNFPGLYGLIGFVIDDASVYPEHNALMMRSDNKWYASFDTCSSKDVVTKGEVWNVSNSYFIDYNPDLYVVEVE